MNKIYIEFAPDDRRELTAYELLAIWITLRTHMNVLERSINFIEETLDSNAAPDEYRQLKLLRTATDKLNPLENPRKWEHINDEIRK